MALKNLYIPNNNFIDLIGSSNGTIGGTVTVPTYGLGYYTGSNRGLVFTGTGAGTASDYGRVDFTRTDFEFSSTDNFTWYTIIKKNSVGSVDWIVANNDTAVPGETSFYMLSDGTLQFSLTDTGNNKAQPTSTNTYTDGKFHHCFCQYNSSTKTAYLYIDDIEEVSVQQSSFTINNFFPVNAKMSIGVTWQQSSSKYRFQCEGTIGLFANFDHFLTASERRSWINRTKQTFCN